ncbi:MAG TPA: L,D-transpeptidase [Nitrospiraceae bacterium]|nr:L,D-transpeptidase [Nitrospiraceae bacterium]
MRSIGYTSLVTGLVGTLLLALPGCIQKIPSEMVEAIESLDRRLVESQGSRYAPDAYGRFVKHWVTLRGQLRAEEDEIVWPWETNPLLAELQNVRAEGEEALVRSVTQREARRLETGTRLAFLEARLHTFNSRVDDMGSRVVLGRKPVETSLLLHQARSFFDQGLYDRSVQTATQVAGMMEAQTSLLTTRLGHYADEHRIHAWRRIAQQTIEWSRAHHTATIVVSKADRRLTVYRNGRQVLSYPVRLGYNGIFEKRYQGDGATPEGQYHIIRKRDRGQTQFYRALVLNYPNVEDRRRFQQARHAGRIPASSFIGGQIEIHGGDDILMSQTLGCVMLENWQMDALFREVEAGTPVTIVGALKLTNSIALALAGLDQIPKGEEG